MLKQDETLERRNEEPGASVDRAPGHEETCIEVYGLGARSVLRRVLHVLLPCPCLGCLAPVWRPAESPGLCDACLERLERSPDDLSEGAHEEPIGAPSWAFEYQSPMDEVIQALKFRRLEYLADPLAALAAPAARRAVLRAGGVDAVVPVPLHWGRLWRRGYDQAALLATALARHLDLPVSRPLYRTRSTPAQSLRGRDQRRRNLAGAFGVRRRQLGARLRGQRVLLVDDVITTGSTLEAAADCLRRGGAGVVLPFAIAHTPERG